MTARILVADQDPDVAEILRLYIEQSGAQVDAVDSASEAVKHARLKQPSAIILSSNLSGASPFQVCSQLLNDPLTGHIPIIMLLHINDRKLRLQALEAGVNDILVKPFDIEELVLRVNAAIRLATR